MDKKSSFKLEPEIFADIFELRTLQPWLSDSFPALQQLIALSDSIEQQALCIDLLKRFFYLDGKAFNVLLKEMESHVNDTWQLDPSISAFAPLHNDNNADSSLLVLQSLKASCAAQGIWGESNFKKSVPQGVHKISDGGNLIIVDEFIGTGHQAEPIISYARTTAESYGKSVSIYLLSVAHMAESENVLSPIVTSYFSPLVMTRGISDYFDASDVAGHIKNMQAMEGKLLPYKDGRTLSTLGYRQSETLYKYENSTTPDNVFPVFHWRWLNDGSARPTVLPPRS